MPETTPNIDIENYYEDRTAYLIRRDELVKRGFVLEFSYDLQKAQGIMDQIEQTRARLKNTGCNIVQIVDDKQTALFYKRD